MIPHNMRYLLPTVYGGAERIVPRNNKQPYLRNLANPNNPNTTEPTDNLTAECVSRKSDGKLREPPNFDRGKKLFLHNFHGTKTPPSDAIFTREHTGGAKFTDRMQFYLQIPDYCFAQHTTHSLKKGAEK